MVDNKQLAGLHQGVHLRLEALPTKKTHNITKQLTTERHIEHRRRARVRFRHGRNTGSGVGLAVAVTQKPKSSSFWHQYLSSNRRNILQYTIIVSFQVLEVDLRTWLAYLVGRIRVEHLELVAGALGALLKHDAVRAWEEVVQHAEAEQRVRFFKVIAAGRVCLTPTPDLPRQGRAAHAHTHAPPVLVQMFKSDPQTHGRSKSYPTPASRKLQTPAVLVY